LTITTFASRSAIEREAARVNAMHSKVSGDYKTKSGASEKYAASDPRFLLWVHCAFTESFLATHLACKYPLDEGSDAYVSQWRESAKPLGLNNAPASQAELQFTIDSFMTNELSYNETTKKVVEFILNPPFGFFTKFFYRILLKAAIVTLRESERELLRLKKPSALWLELAKFNLRVLKRALGEHPPAQDAAMARLRRIGKL
jgi:uncharacterized protein (DUF2236 family)